MISASRPRLVVAAAVVIFTVLSCYLLSQPASAGLPLISFSSSSSSSSSSASTADSSSLTPEDTDRVNNSTLGFGKVFVVGLPERTNQRDAIALTSSLTGFDVEWVDGVHGKDVPDHALPFGVDRAALTDSNLGSWRSHMNAVRRYLRSACQTCTSSLNQVR